MEVESKCKEHDVSESKKNQNIKEQTIGTDAGEILT